MTFEYLVESPFFLVLAILTLILGAGRLTRIIYWDAFPPAMKVRMAWDRLTGDSSWNKLLHCPWCLAPWIILGGIGWYAWGNIEGWHALNIAWWVFWGWLAMAYMASMIIVRDEPAE